MIRANGQRRKYKDAESRRDNKLALKKHNLVKNSIIFHIFESSDHFRVNLSQIDPRAYLQIGAFQCLCPSHEPFHLDLKCSDQVRW